MATATATLTATATSAVTLSNPLSLDELQLLGTPTINIDATVPVAGLMGLEEGKYIMVEPTTTASTNGERLAAAYTDAKALSGLSATSRATVLVPPGHYTLAADLEMDTQYVDIVGIGQNPRSIFIDGSQVDQRVANCNISGVWIEQLQNNAAGSADITCVLENCIFGTTGTQALQTGDAFTRTFLRCRFNNVGRRPTRQRREMSPMTLGQRMATPLTRTLQSKEETCQDKQEITPPWPPSWGCVEPSQVLWQTNS